MAMGRRKAERQETLFLPVGELPKSPGHPFYQALNRLLAEADFDRWAEDRCRPYYTDSTRGQPSLPPGVYFRMLFVGYYEGIGSQRGIAWRCSDSLSLRDFLGIAPDRQSPDHSTLSLTRTRLPPEVFQEVFEFVLRVAHEKKLLKGKTVGVDSTTLEADAAMKSIVRRDTGEDWQTYVAGLMRAEGVIAADEEPSDEDVRRFDKGRKDKTVSNEEWVNPHDPEAKIARMKDGTTHLAYKAEHVVDLDSDLIVAAEIRSATDGDAQTLADSVMQAQQNLRAIGSEQLIEEVAADKGYHSADALELCRHLELRTYIPEPKRNADWTWTDKTPEHKHAVHGNRQRVRRRKGKQMQRRRSEVCERTFAHVCDSGGMRRTWLKGLVDVTKRYLVATAAHNLGRMLRTLFGVGKPRALQGFGGVSADGSARESALGRRLVALRVPLTSWTLRPSDATPCPAL
ncbi:MAG TPA: transposase, partial [Planctomycetaceae bacterium]|nr:transposase [Planctomycetaceae bacterium]